MSEINVKNLTAEEKAALLAELQADASNSRIQKREAYEACAHSLFMKFRKRSLCLWLM